MARLCIRLAANNHPTDLALTPMRTRPGDVVEVCEDGHQWRPGELNSGQYKFVDVPGVPASTFDNLKAPLLAADGVTMIRRRNQCLDPTIITAGAWRNRTTATLAQIVAATITRTS